MQNAAQEAREILSAENANSFRGRLRAKLLAWGLGSLERFYKLIGGKQNIWPPTRKSAPLLSLFWGTIVALIYLQVRETRNKAVVQVEELRREYAMSSLQNIVTNEYARVEDHKQKEQSLRELGMDAALAESMTRKQIKEVKTERTEARKRARAEKRAAGLQLTHQELADEANEEADRKAELAKTADQRAADDLDDKIEPPAEKLFELVFDEIEHSPITSIGVPEDDPYFNEGMRLLRIRVNEEMREAIDKTREARRYTAGMSGKSASQASQDGGAKDLYRYLDGSRMVKRARFAKDQVRKGLKGKHREFNRQAIRELDALVKESLRFSKQIGAEQKAAAQKIWQLLKPWQAMYWSGTIIRCFAGVSWGFWYGRIMSLPSVVLAHADPAVALQQAGSQSILMFVWFLFNWPLDQIAHQLVNNTQAHFTLGLRDAVMESILFQDREFFDFNQAGALQERLNHDTGVLAHNIIRQPADFLQAVCQVVAKGGFVYSVSPSLFKMTIAVPVPLTTCLCWASIEYLRSLHRKIHKVNEVAASGTIDILKEVTTVRQFAMEDREHHRYSTTNLFRRILERRLAASDRFTWGMIGAGFWGTQILVTYMGLREIIYPIPGMRPVSVADLVTVGVALHDIMWNMRYLADLIPELMKLEEPIQRVAATLDARPIIEPHPNTRDNGKPVGIRPSQIKGHLVFENIKFTYPTERQKPVLRGFSMEVKPGQKVACVGKAGCGKSTSIGILQRLYDVDEGLVTIDGIPIGDYDVHHLRRCIGIVAQDNVLFSMSIKENITYGMGQGHLPMPTDEEIWEMCEKCNAKEFIESFPNLLNTHVGEKGVKLSGGQKQRIAIVRAMIRKPTILLLDEATSALDPVNEKVVQRALDRMMLEFSGVAIVIAHRLTTIKNCDNIIVMEKGQKVEEGTHEELMRIQVIKDEDDTVVQGYFHNQWDTQMGEETFGDVSHMNDEQLSQKKVWWAQQIEEVEKEVQKRGLTVSQLRRLEPRTSGDRVVSDSEDEEEEEEESEDASEGDDIFVSDYRKGPAGNYRAADYRAADDYRRAEEAEEEAGDEPGDYRRGYD